MEFKGNYYLNKIINTENNQKNIKFKNYTLYIEIYSFLLFLGMEYIEKIPVNIYSFLKEQIDKDDIVKINSKSDLEKISQDALAFLIYLDMKYWNKNKKGELLKIYQLNDLIEEKRKREKYNYDKLFKNSSIDTYNESSKEKSQNMIVLEEKSGFQKFINNIKLYLKKFLNK